MRTFVLSILLIIIAFPFFGKVINVQPVEVANRAILYLLKQETAKLKKTTSCDMHIYDSYGDTICALNFDGTSDFVKDSTAHFFFQQDDCSVFLHGTLASSFSNINPSIPSQAMDVDDFELILTESHPYLIRNDSAFNLIPHFDEYERNILYYWGATDFIKERYHLDSTDLITLFYCEDLSCFYDLIKDDELKTRLSSSAGNDSITSFPYRKRKINDKQAYLSFSRFSHNLFSALLSSPIHNFLLIFEEEEGRCHLLKEVPIKGM